MTVFECHLQLDQRLQEVASYKNNKYKPEELDMALNKAMFRLLEMGVASGFEENQVNLSHVSALIQKNNIAELIIPSTNDVLYEDNVNTLYTTVPTSLYWLINARVEVVTDKMNCETAPTLGTTTYNEYVTTLAFPIAGSSAPYYTNTTILSSIQGNLYTSPTTVAGGFNNINSKYVLINNITEYFYRKYPTIKVYWERYRDGYSANSFIIVSIASLGNVSMTSGAVTTTGATTTAIYTVYNRSGIPSITNAKIETQPVKVLQQDKLYETLKQNVYYKSRAREITMSQTYDYFTFYKDESFLITRMYYDYIRKPRTISLILNQSCELADTTHPKIIDLAVEILRLDIKDQSYPQTVQDTQLRTN